MSYTILLLVLLVALIFEYINGFHDSANAIATVISTKVLSPRNAIIYGAIFNFFGAFSGTHVAKTIGAGIIDTTGITQTVILCGLTAAIVWNLITWYYGLPSSSSHALIGGLLGAAIAYSNTGVVNFHGLYYKILVPMIVSPCMGFVVGFIVMLLLLRIFYHAHPDKTNKYFRKLQLLSSAFMAFGHGSNDAQKTMGIITMSLCAFKVIDSFEVPFWVILSCALTMGLGTMAGGWRIIHTMGDKMIKLRPIHGFAVELTASIIILFASFFGIPVSTTHVKTTSVMGVGSTIRLSAVKWGLVGNILWAWVLTIPICAFLAAILFYLQSIFN
ncbi:MAG: inorganic phosphate transporter [Oligoflexia bacterium]|nr:inorganic phosphate transporter [Oligoflexia bacterium]